MDKSISVVRLKSVVSKSLSVISSPNFNFDSSSVVVQSIKSAVSVNSKSVSRVSSVSSRHRSSKSSDLLEVRFGSEI